MDEKAFKDRLQALLSADEAEAAALTEETIAREAKRILDRTLASVPFFRKHKKRGVPVMRLTEVDHLGMARDGYLAPIPQRVYTTIAGSGFYPEIEKHENGHVLWLLFKPSDLL